MGNNVVSVELKVVDNLTQNTTAISQQFGTEIKKMASSVSVLDDAVKINYGRTQEYTRALTQVTGALRTSADAEKDAAVLAKTSARMRKDAIDEAAKSAVKSSQKSADDIARVQVNAEKEYERVNAQAAAAEAMANASRFQRNIEKEKVYHQSRLQALAGNDAAQEAEQRRHDAVMLALQADSTAKSATGARMAIARIGTIGNQVQSLQMAFFGIGTVVDGTDSKFGKIIGSTAMLASGAMGMSQAYEAATTSMAGMNLTMGLALPVLGAIGIAMAVVLEHHKHLAELAKDNSWLGDATKYAQVVAAVDGVAAAEKQMAKDISASGVAYGNYAGMVSSATKGLQDFESENRKLQDITGLTRDELLKLYGSLEQAKEEFALVSGTRMADLEAQYQKAVIEATEEGSQKQIDLQKISNDKAMTDIRTHFAAIILDTKKTAEEKKRASIEEGKELAIQAKINNENLLAIQHSISLKEQNQEAQDEAEALARANRVSEERSKKERAALGKMFEEQFRLAEDAKKKLEALQNTNEQTDAKNPRSPSSAASLEKEHQAALQDIKDKYAKNGFEKTKTYLALIDQVNVLYADKEKARKQSELEAEAKLFQEKTGYYQQYADSVSQMIGVLGGKSKVAFALQQSIALAEIAMRTAVAVTTDGLDPLTAWKVPYDIALGATQGAVVAGLTIKGFERGTNYAPPGLAWVGERGPELVNFRGGEQVHTASRSAQMASGGGNVHMGDMHFYFGNDVSPATAQMVGREVNRAVRGIMKGVTVAGRRNVRG